MSGCRHDPACELGPHDKADHPCGRKIDRPGEKCRPCAEQGIHRTVPASGYCVCWTVLDDLPHADVKALMAGIDLSLTRRPR